MILKDECHDEVSATKKKLLLFEMTFACEEVISALKYI